MDKKPTKVTPLVWTEKEITTPIQQRNELWKWVCKWTGNPELVNFAAGLIRKYNVPERNEKALARAVQRFAQTNIKFFRERPERFAGPLRTILWGFGDCDDKSVLIASILRSFRIPIKLKFIRFTYKKNGETKKVSHVYPLAKLDGH